MMFTNNIITEAIIPGNKSPKSILKPVVDINIK